MKAPSQRQLRVGELVRHALSDILARGDVRGADLGGSLISVSEVRMSPDLKIATAFIAPIGPGDAQAMCKALAGAQKDLRHQIGRRLKLRFTPTLRFLPDTSYDAFGRIDDILRSPEVVRDTGRRSGYADAPDEDGDQ
ncbi:MAG: 30S ribosome-binding factor RbfA [Devosiaceae bacterium]|nr:30S ribosome-binding factor RbfA [Devosiaceae bacterium MH13]